MELGTLGMGLAVIIGMLAILVSAVLMIIGPIVLPALVYKVLRRNVQKPSTVICISLVIILAVAGWPLSGLIALQFNYSKPNIVKTSSDKLGPIGTILIDGPMFGIDELITVERPVPLSKDRYMRRGPLMKPKSISEADLHSKYMVTVNIPQNGNFLQRYLTKSYVVIKERSTRKIIAKLDEELWGGGLIGHYISLLSGNSPFESRYLSSGYASAKIGKYRFGRERIEQYKKVDRGLIEEIFTLQLTPDTEGDYPNHRVVR